VKNIEMKKKPKIIEMVIPGYIILPREGK